MYFKIPNNLFDKIFEKYPSYYFNDNLLNYLSDYLYCYLYDSLENDILRWNLDNALIDNIDGKYI
jgi:hypothetical protein